MTLVVIVLAILGSLIVLRLLIFVIAMKRLEAHWSQTYAASKAGNFTLVALGDSTMQGVGATAARYTLVGRIAAYIHDQHRKEVRIANLSKSGAGIDDIIDRQVAVAPISETDLIVISIGANDILHGMEFETFKEKYMQLLDSLPKDRVIVANVGLVTYHRNRQISGKVWNPQLKAFFAEQNVHYAPMFDPIIARLFYPRIYAADCFHPSNFAYKLGAEMFESEIDEIIWQSVQR